MASRRVVPLVTAVLVAAAVVVGGSAVVATAAVGSGTVKVCTTHKGVVVSASKKSRCPKGTTKRKVDVQGARGPAGARGPTGPRGPAGQAGAPGSVTAWALISGSQVVAGSTNVKAVTRPRDGVVCVSFTRPIAADRRNAAIVQTADRVTGAFVVDPFTTRSPCASDEVTISTWTDPNAPGLPTGTLRLLVP